MKNVQNFIWVLALVGPTLLMAQPPEEELSPTAPEFNIEVMDAPTPTETTPAPAVVSPTLPTQTIQPILTTPSAVPAQIPVAEAVAKPAEVKEDKSIKGITLSPAVKVQPLSYNGERKQAYFGIQPSVALDTVFKTGAGREIALNLAYGLEWDEFLSNRSAALRYFEHDLSGSATIAWTDAFSTSFGSGINYSLWASSNREHAIINDTTALGTFKINDQVSVTTGYRAFFFNNLDSPFHLSDGSFPGDADDLFTANPSLGGADNYNADPNSVMFDYDPVVGNAWFTNNGLKLTPTAKFGSTSLKLDYEYVFYTFTNSPDADWRGHVITPSITQNMPWKGGTVTLKEQLRLRSYQSALNDDGSIANNFRNRLTLAIGQSINDSISAEFTYRWQLTGSNADNYAAKTSEYLIQMAFTFTF